MLRRRKSLLTASALAVVAVISSLALADDPPGALAGRWRERRGLVVRTSDVVLQPCPARPDTWVGETVGPRSHEPVRVTLRRTGSGWSLVRERRVEATVGASGVLEGREASGWTWGDAREVALALEDGRLRGGGFDLPAPASASRATVAAETTTGRAAIADGALGETTPERPVVRVLLTGFDRFPTLRNHPSLLSDGQLRSREPSTNPAGWAVRSFDPTTLDVALRRDVQVDVHRMLDLCVHYVEAGQRVADEIARIDADVCISFGVGSDGNVDADVETTCFNRMSDGSMPFGRSGEGPFQLPASWPPLTPEPQWSAEDSFWTWRYPDNAGVSMAGKAIDSAQGARLTSSLPVKQIVARVKREGLEAHDGQGGPGEYVCNSVMFKVVETQAARGKIGGFVHIAQWEDRRRESYLKVVRCAVEESVKAVLAARASR